MEEAATAVIRTVTDQTLFDHTKSSHVSGRRIGTSAKAIALVIVSVAALFSSSEAQAAETGFAFRATATSSDNIRRVPVLEEDETIASAGASAEWLQESRRLDINLLADFEHREYTNGTFEDETLPSLVARAEFGIVPDIVTWIIENRLGQILSDPLLVETPDNRALGNSFYTGPSVRLPLGGRSAFQVDARYGRNDFEDLDTDNDTSTGRIRFIRILSKNRNLSLNLQQDEIRYDDNVNNTDFERSSLYIALESRISKGELVAQVGTNAIEFGVDEKRRPLVGFSFTRSLTARTTLKLGYDQRFAEVGEIFRRYADDERFFAETATIAATGGSPIEFERLGMSVDVRSERVYWLLYVGRQDEKPLQMTINVPRQLDEFVIDGRWSLSSSWRARIVGQVRKSDFSSLDREDEDVEAGLTLSYQLSRLLFFDFGYGYFQRKSTVTAQEGSENRYFMAIRWDNR